jgi:hypothetical protein
MNRADSSRHKPVFHFNRIVPKRSVFLCFLSASVELMTSTQKKMLRHVTIRLKWKTGLSTSLKMFVTRINPIGLTIARLIYYVYKLTLREFIHWDKYLAVHTYTHLMIACRESLAWCWQFPTIICFSARTYVFFRCGCQLPVFESLRVVYFSRTPLSRTETHFPWICPYTISIIFTLSSRPRLTQTHHLELILLNKR